jgi:sec-independent protein translocase protein TatA|tara:strand:+ start:235 stop:420 length:186 start_codon:yes stop_codon:yes gene_type:complete
MGCSEYFLAGVFGWQQILIIALILLLLFGGKKIPELMKGLGKGVKEFKDATNKEEDSENKA